MNEFFTELETACPATKAYREAGHRWHKSTGSAGQRYDALLQKAIYRDGVKAFWVNVEVWDHRKWGEDRIGLTADSQMETKSGQTFNVTLLYPGDAPAETEAFFARIFDAMDCKNYDN